MAKKKTGKAKKNASPALTKARNKAVGKKMKQILNEGGTKPVTKTVYKISPKKALAEASKYVKKNGLA